MNLLSRKNVIEAAHLKSMKHKSPTLNLDKRGKSTPKQTFKRYKKKRSDEADSESNGNISFHEDSDMDTSDGRSDSESNALVDNGDWIISCRSENLNASNNVLVKCHCTKNNDIMYFVAIINSKDGNMFLVSFMKKMFGYK